LYPDGILCRWATISDEARRNGRPISPADAWIAATALALGLPVVTHNPGDYRGVEGLTVLTAGNA
jgi:tRNA(fMet)-specific endonuclease VapC